MKQLTAIIFLSLFALPGFAGHPAPPVFSGEELRLEAETQYFRTEANYQSEWGEFTRLAQGNYFQVIELNLGAHYFLNPAWEINGGATIAFSESSNSGQVLTNSGLSKLYLGTSFFQMWHELGLTPTITLHIPIFGVDPNLDAVMLGEGAMRLEGGSFGDLDVGAFNLLGYLGFAYRGDGRSSLVRWQAGAYKFINKFRIGANVSGEHTIIDDDYVATPAIRDNIVNQVNGGSFHFYGVNPEELAASIWGDLNFANKAELRFGVKQTLNGANSAAGLSTHLAATWSLGNSDQKGKTRRRRQSFEVDYAE